MVTLRRESRLIGWLVVAGVFSSPGGQPAHASDHLDTPTVIADPAADIGDIFGWTASDGRRLNLVMDIVAHQFSDRLQYVFHVDSGERFGKTTATTVIVCRFDVAQTAECWAGNADYVRGDASGPAGVEGSNRRFRVFAGLRDDPFFNNVKGTRTAYGVAAAAVQHGAKVDGAGCPLFDDMTAASILGTWEHTDGGPATNFLAGWKASALVISIDLDVVSAGGRLLAVWGAVHKAAPTDRSKPGTTPGKTPALPQLGVQIERTARPLIKNGLIAGPLRSDVVSDRRKESYNRVDRSNWKQFASDIQESLGVFDGFDGECGNQWLADPREAGRVRYQILASVLADDRIWINSSSAVCTQFLAVELTEFATPGALSGDCGGRTPTYDASNIFRSLLTIGKIAGVDDGLSHDDKVHSTTVFPFLAAP